MENENPISTLSDYSRPSHEGYQNTIELPNGNNVVPLRSDAIWLVQNGCSFHGLRFEDPNQHLKDFLKLVDSLDLDQDPSPLRRILLLISLLNSFYRMDLFQGLTPKSPSSWHRSLALKKAWSIIEELAQYEEEGWNDPIFAEEGSLNYGNASIEQILKLMESQVDSLMKNIILLIGKSENLCGISSNELGCFPPEPSHQEEFEGLLTNFILGQEEKFRQHEEYMSVIGSDFMQLSLEVVKKLKEEIRVKENKSKMI
ncbi:hypothetical protein Tco_0881776 [Tanacetum coccineum]